MAFSANYISLPLLVHNDSFNGCLPEDVRKIIDIKKNDPLLILYIGRFDLVKVKNSNLPLFDLISSCRLLLGTNRNFHIFYIGDGKEYQKMQGKITENKVDEYVTMLGPKNNIFDYINICHLGVGGVAFNGVSEEYTVAGIPQLLVKCGANDNTPWEDMRNSVFVKGGSTFDIAEKLGWAIDNRRFLKKIGRNAKQDMEKWITDTKAGGRLYLKEFKKILDQ